MPDGGEQHDDRPHEYGEAVAESDTAHPLPGDIVVGPESSVMPEPLVGRAESTPLEDDEPEGTIPPSPLWAMKDRRHIQWHLLPHHERHERIRAVLGEADGTVYVIDDGRHHISVGRRIGSSAECEYCLIGRLPIERYEQLASGAVPALDAFDGADELTVCGVAAEEGVASSNVFDVARYDAPGDIPRAYRPGAPYLQLKGDLEITLY